MSFFNGLSNFHRWKFLLKRPSNCGFMMLLLFFYGCLPFIFRENSFLSALKPFLCTLYPFLCGLFCCSQELTLSFPYTFMIIYLNWRTMIRTNKCFSRLQHLKYLLRLCVIVHRCFISKFLLFCPLLQDLLSFHLPELHFSQKLFNIYFFQYFFEFLIFLH